MRDGVPLPATTADAVLSQLAHRVFGPVRRDRVQSMLDYHGLAGHPAAPIPRVAARHCVHPATIGNWVGVLRAAGSRLPLSEDLIAQISRRSTDGEDHRGRTRIATTLGLPPPGPPVRRGAAHRCRRRMVVADRPSFAAGRAAWPPTAPVAAAERTSDQGIRSRDTSQTEP